MHVNQKHHIEEAGEIGTDLCTDRRAGVLAVRLLRSLLRSDGLELTLC